MWNKSRKIIELVELGHKGDGEVENGCIELTWDEIISFFSNHEVRGKKDGYCFMPVQMKERQDWVLSEPRLNHEPTYRNDLNVHSITMAVIDLDQKDSLPKAEEIFSEFEYFIYSTHSYTAETPYKFRMVISLNEPVMAEDWPATFKKITMGIDADRCCGNLSRVFFYPSIAMDAGIEPFFKHNKGRELTHKDIIQLEKKYINTLSDDERNEIKRQQALANLGYLKRHFSGESSSLFASKYKTIDYSYDEMKKRHSKNISELSAVDSRHNFALKTIAREIGMFKENTDIYHLALFIHRAAFEFSSRDMFSGNTNNEMPEMVISALRKFTPEFEFQKEELYEVLNTAAKSAQYSMDCGQWDFMVDKVSVKNNEFDREVLLDVPRPGFSYLQLKERNQTLLKEYGDAGNINEFAASVLHKELIKHGAGTDINAVGQFVFFCYRAGLEKGIPANGVKDVVASTSGSIIDAVMKDPRLSEQSDETMKFVKTSMLIARKSAMGDIDWRFPREVSKNNDLTP
ncbi:hypothetical protein D3C87_662760 [compost metagenome]